MKVEILKSGMQRVGGDGDAGEAIARLMTGLRDPFGKASAIDSFVANIKNRSLDSTLLTSSLLQMAHLQRTDVIDIRQFETLMTTLVGAVDGGLMEPATAADFVRAANNLPAEAKSPELLLKSLQVLGKAVHSTNDEGIMNAAANAVADMTDAIQDLPAWQKKYFDSFWDAATGVAPKTPDPQSKAMTVAEDSHNIRPDESGNADPLNAPAPSPPLPDIDAWLVEDPVQATRRSSPPPLPALPSRDFIDGLQLNPSRVAPQPATGKPLRPTPRSADGPGFQVSPSQLEKHLELLLRSDALQEEDRRSSITQACRNAAATLPADGDATGHAAIWVNQILPPSPSLADVNKALKSLEPQRTIPLTDEAIAELAIAEALDAPEPANLNSPFEVSGERTTQVNEVFARQLAVKAFDDLSLRSHAFGEDAVTGISENLASAFKAALKAQEASAAAQRTAPPLVSARARGAGDPTGTAAPPPPVS